MNAQNMNMHPFVRYYILYKRKQRPLDRRHVNYEFLNCSEGHIHAVNTQVLQINIPTKFMNNIKLRQQIIVPCTTRLEIIANLLQKKEGF